jgi:hypothetical protein
MRSMPMQTETLMPATEASEIPKLAYPPYTKLKERITRQFL